MNDTSESVKRNLREVRSTLPDGVELIAVSKYHPAEAVLAAYEEGQRKFGESQEQALRLKHEALPKDIEWHFIGHLQTNKVKYIAPYVAMIEAVDSLRLMREIDRQAKKNGRIIDILLEIHVAEEDSKFGLKPEECLKMMAEGEWRELENVRICGLMTMATNTDDEERIAQDFAAAYTLYNNIKEKYFPEADYFSCRSWGMSDDYPIAIRHGSNMVRVGTRIFTQI